MLRSLDCFMDLREAEQLAESAQTEWREWQQRTGYQPKRITPRDIGYDPETMEKLPLPDIEDVHPAILLELGLMK